MNQFSLFPDYPDGPATGKTDTSAGAAMAIHKDTARVRVIVFNAIRDAGTAGLTTPEIAAHTRIPYHTVQPRTSELRRQDRIIDSGKRRPNPDTGKASIVWCVSAKET